MCARRTRRRAPSTPPSLTLHAVVWRESSVPSLFVSAPSGTSPSAAAAARAQTTESQHDATGQLPVLYSKKPELLAAKPSDTFLPRMFTGMQNVPDAAVHHVSNDAPHDFPMHTIHDRSKLLAEARDGIRGEQLVVQDDPAPFVRRLTLNAPERRNAMDHLMRSQLLHKLQVADQDPSVRVTIIRGSGAAFCAGYNLSMDMLMPLPQFEAGGQGRFQRAVLSVWLSFMDLAKPVIAQVHGHCLAGGSELAAACDIVMVAENAKIGYPPVRSMGLPDTQIFPWLMGLRQSMYLMLTGDSMDGAEAVRTGWATRCFPEDRLEEGVLAAAKRVARIPSDLLQFNKRSVHRAMEVMGMRTHLRAHTDMSALSQESPTAKAFMKRMYESIALEKNKKAVTEALNRRDSAFSDGRTAIDSNIVKSNSKL